MNNIPYYVYATFCITIVATLYLFYKATSNSRGILIAIGAWLMIQSIFGIAGFYTVTNTMPPRFNLLVVPPIAVIIYLFSSRRGRQFINTLDLKTLTLLHIVRVPVEIVLYWLFLHKAVPELMTFEGRNFDIIAGITAPVIYYFGFVKNTLTKSILIGWNILCLGLLLNIVFNGILSVPTPFQQFGFDQPNIALLHFPFIFLPALIVPIVLFSHLSSIRQLMGNKSMRTESKFNNINAI